MPVKSVQTRILVDELDLSTMSNSAGVDITAGSEDVTTFQASGKQFLTLDPSMTISIGGYFTDAAAGLDAVLNDRLSNNATVAIQFGTDSPAAPVYVLENANTQQFDISAPVPGVIAVQGQWQPNSPKRGGTVGWGTATAAGSLPASNIGMGTFEFFLLVHSATGITDAVISVDESADGSTGWTSVFSFPAFSAAGVYIDNEAVTGPFLRATVTNMGGGTEIIYTLFIVPSI